MRLWLLPPLTLFGKILRLDRYVITLECKCLRSGNRRGRTAYAETIPLASLGHSTFQVVLRVVLTQIFTELSTDFHGFYCGSVDRQVTVSLTEALRRL